MDIPAYEVRDHGDGRDIYCYMGRDLWLRNYSHRVINNEFDLSQSIVPMKKKEEEASSLIPLTMALAGGAALLGYGVYKLLEKKEDPKDTRKPAQSYYQ